MIYELTFCLRSYYNDHVEFAVVLLVPWHQFLHAISSGGARYLLIFPKLGVKRPPSNNLLSNLSMAWVLMFLPTSHLKYDFSSNLRMLVRSSGCNCCYFQNSFLTTLRLQPVALDPDGLSVFTFLDLQMFCWILPAVCSIVDWIKSNYYLVQNRYVYIPYLSK